MKMDDITKNEFRRENLCFTCRVTCREPWELGHRCFGKGQVNRMEVVCDDENEPKEPKPYPVTREKTIEDSSNMEDSSDTLVALSGAPWYQPFRVCGYHLSSGLLC